MKRIALIVALVLIVPACGAGGRNKIQRDLLRAVDATEREPRTFTYSERTASGTVVVRGEVEDDLRYSGSVLVGGAITTQVVVADDALAVRFPDPSRGVPALERVAAEDRGAAEGLAQGRWVIDYSAAPPLTAPQTREGTLRVGQDPVLDASYIFQYIRRSITEATAVTEFNPDDVQYNPADDPFSKQVPSRASGVKRYDLEPPPLPRRSQRGTSAALPTTQMFRKMAFFVRGDRLVRVLEAIDVEGQKDFRRAVRAGGPKYFLELLEAVREGKTREPVRERRMSYEISLRKTEVKLPLEDALAGSLVGLVGTNRGVVVGGQPSPQP